MQIIFHYSFLKEIGLDSLTFTRKIMLKYFLLLLTRWILQRWFIFLAITLAS